MEAKSEVLTEAMGKAKEAAHRIIDGNKGGIPFFWALFFAVVLLAAIWLGHHLTIKGQEQMRGAIESRPSPVVVAPQSHDPRVADSLAKTSENMGGLTKSIGALGQNVGSLVADFDKQMDSVRQDLSSMSQSIESINQLQKSIKDLQESLRGSAAGKADPALGQKIDTLTKLMEAKKDATDFGPIHKELTTVNQNVLTLAAIFKEKLKGEEIRLNALGEEFPRK